MQPYEMSTRDTMRIFFKRRKTLAWVIGLSLVGTYLGLSLTMPRYKSEVRLLVSGIQQIDSPYYTAISSSRTVDIASTVSEVIKSRDLLRDTVVMLNLDTRSDFEAEAPFLRRIVDGLYRAILKNPYTAFRNALTGIGERMPAGVRAYFAGKNAAARGDYATIEKTIDRLSKNIRVDSIERTDVIRLIVYDYNPEVAAKVADTIAKKYLVFNMEQQLFEYRTKYGDKHPRVYQLENELNGIKKRLTQDAVAVEEIMSPGNVKIIERAAVPIRPVKPNKPVAYVVALILSVVLGLALIFLLEAVDHSVRTPADIERYVGLTILASVPDTETTGTTAEVRRGAYELFVGRLHLLLKERRSISLAVTSIERGEGKSTVAGDIATLLSGKGHLKTLLIDANFNGSPAAHASSKPAAGAGLGDLLEDKVSLESVKHTVAEHLDVIASGRPRANLIALLKGERLRAILEEAKKRYDVVIVDAPSLKGPATGLLLCKQVDEAILVIKESGTRREVIRDTLAKIENDRIQFLGSILNRQRYFIPERIYNHV